MSSLWRATIPVGLTILLVFNVAAQKQVIGQTGREIFLDRCGACHGADGKGDGPAVGSLKFAPGDLTLLAQINGGTFPTDRVRKIVGEWVDIGAHGSREMPIWGGLFLPKSAAEEEIATERFKKVISYMESIQQ